MEFCCPSCSKLSDVGFYHLGSHEKYRIEEMVPNVNQLHRTSRSIISITSPDAEGLKIS